MASTQHALDRAKRQQQTRLSNDRLWHGDRKALRRMIVWLQANEPMSATDNLERVLEVLDTPSIFNDEWDRMVAEEHGWPLRARLVDEDRDALITDVVST